MEKYWIIGGGVLLGVLLIGSIIVSLSNDEMSSIRELLSTQSSSTCCT